MLVLTRKAGESVVVGNVKVSILEICGNRVSVGIEAPRDMAIRREKLNLEAPPSPLLRTAETDVTAHPADV